jgi:hypothetical protein
MVRSYHYCLILSSNASISLSFYCAVSIIFLYSASIYVTFTRKLKYEEWHLLGCYAM